MRTKPLFSHIEQRTLTPDENALLLSGQERVKAVGDGEADGSRRMLGSAPFSEKYDGKKTSERESYYDAISSLHQAYIPDTVLLHRIMAEEDHSMDEKRHPNS